MQQSKLLTILGLTLTGINYTQAQDLTAEQIQEAYNNMLHISNPTPQQNFYPIYGNSVNLTYVKAPPNTNMVRVIATGGGGGPGGGAQSEGGMGATVNAVYQMTEPEEIFGIDTGPGGFQIYNAGTGGGYTRVVNTKATIDVIAGGGGGGGYASNDFAKPQFKQYVYGKPGGTPNYTQYDLNSMIYFYVGDYDVSRLPTIASMLTGVGSAMVGWDYRRKRTTYKTEYNGGTGAAMYGGWGNGSSGTYPNLASASSASAILAQSMFYNGGGVTGGTGGGGGGGAQGGQGGSTMTTNSGIEGFGGFGGTSVARGSPISVTYSNNSQIINGISYGGVSPIYRGYNNWGGSTGQKGNATLYFYFDPNYPPLIPPTTFNFFPIEFTYNGTVQKPQITSTTPVLKNNIPIGVDKNATYNTSITATTPIDAGNYILTTTATGNYFGVGTCSFLIKKAQPEIKITNLTQTYDGQPKNVNVDIVPAGLNVVVKYNNSTTIPTQIGTYLITVTANNNNYTGNKTEILIITKPANNTPTINWTNNAPTIPFNTSNPLNIQATATDIDNNLQEIEVQFKRGNADWTPIKITSTTTNKTTLITEIFSILFNSNNETIQFRAQARDSEGANSDWLESNVYSSYIANNNPPEITWVETPNANTCFVNTNLYAQAQATDINGNLIKITVQYRKNNANWEDLSTTTTGTGEGFTKTSTRNFTQLTNFNDTLEFRAQATDSTGSTSNWLLSDKYTTTNQPPTASWAEIPDITKIYHTGDILYAVAQATDPDGNLAQIQTEYRRNSGTWLQLSYVNGTETQTARLGIEYLSPLAEAIQFRYKATDTQNATTDWVESPNYISTNQPPTTEWTILP